MRTQHVDYPVHEMKIGRVPGCGHTDGARFIFHTGSTAYLFGKHEGRTLVVEFITFGFLLRFRLLQTAKPTEPDWKVYGRYKGEPISAPAGWGIIPEGEEIPQEHREYSVVGYGMWCEWRRCHSTMTPLAARIWGSVRAYAGRAA